MRISRRATLKGGAALAVAAVASPFVVSPSRANTTLRMQGFLGPNSPTHRAFEQMASEVAKETGGKLAIQFGPAGSVVSATETIDAINSGILDGHYSSPSFFAAKRPAFRVLGDTGAGFDEVDVRDRWFQEKGGVELGRELYDQVGLYYVDQVYWPSEHIPSTRPLNGVDDLDGLKIRVPPGMISEVFGRVGAAVVNLPGAEVFNALQSGVIDATDWANPGLNNEAGLYRVATHSVNASHSMPTTEVSFDKEKWAALPDEFKTLITDKVAALSGVLRDQIRADDAAAIEEITANGVEIIRWSSDEIARLRNTTTEVQNEDASKDPTADKIVSSMQAFQKELGI